MFIIDTHCVWELNPAFEQAEDEIAPGFEDAGCRDYFAMYCMM